MPPTIAAVLDYVGVGFFAASGALAAAEKRQDIVTFIFFGALTGIGGGTLRDLLIGVPVFWVHNPAYVIVCAVAAAAMWVAPIHSDDRALLWLDAVGLASYAVVGAHKAWAHGVAAPVCVVMGVLTACFGGVLRDVLAGQPSVLLRRDLYVTPVIAGALVDIACLDLGLPALACSAAGFVVGFSLRAGSLVFGWRLPQFGGSPDQP